MSIKQMGDDNADGFVDRLTSGSVKQNYNDATDRNAPKVDPYPSADDVLLSPEPSPKFVAGDLRAVTVAAGNSKIVGDITSGMPMEGVSGAPARIGAGDMVSDYIASEASSAGAEDVFSAELVGDMVAGKPRDGYPRGENVRAQLSPEGLVTGRSNGGYAPGTNQPTVTSPAGKQPSNDRGVAGSADIKAAN